MNFAAARRAMVDGQIRTNDVTDLGLLAAMLEIPREAFVPAQIAPLAYLDRDLPLNARHKGLPDDEDFSGADGPTPAERQLRWLIKPAVLARLIQAAAPQPHDRALVIGAGTGYSAAILSRLAAAVTALEEDVALARRAQSIVSQLGIGHVTIATGALDAGWAASAPYDVILLDGGVELVPQPLFDQMGGDGRLAAVIRQGAVGKGTVFVSDKGAVSGRVIFDAMAPPLPGFARPPAFVF